MKLGASSLSLALSVLVGGAAAAELQYGHNHDDEGQHRNLLSGDLGGYWSQLSSIDFCIEKIDDPDDATSDKAKFMPCDASKPAQMWQFDKTAPNPNFAFGGLLFNMNGGCLAIRGDVDVGKNLKILECDRNNAKQHWLSTGDQLKPRDYRAYCVSPLYDPTIARDPVVILKCEDTWSLDY